MAAAISVQDDGIFEDEAGAKAWLGDFLAADTPTA